MKNNTLLKVLSATAIFSALAAIEAYDHDDFAFAADENPIVATTNSPATTNKPVTNNVATSNTPAVTNANAKPTAKQDVKNLKNGEYSIDVKATNFATGGPSMAAAAIKADETKLTVKDGKYSVDITFQPISRDMNGKQFKGYLGDLKYYDGNVEKQNVNSSTPKEATIVESYKESEKDDYFDTYKSKYPERKAYPKVMSYSIDKNKIDSNNKLETYNEVYVPVMDSLMPGFGLGNQKLTLTFDFNTIKEKVTADNYEAATYKNPNKDKEYTGTPLKKEFPLNVQGHLRNANNNDEESLYGPALDSNVKVEKTGDKYKYTFRLKPGLANVGGEFYPFEIVKISYQDKEIPLTTLASSKKGSIKEGSIVSDKLLEKIQLDGTAPYPNGALMSHFVTLQLYYDTANAWKDRPAVIEDVETPKPSPKPTPTKPIEEKPKPVVSTVPDHEVEADKVPSTFPTSVKGELKYQKDNSQLSTYANLFEKDVTVEKVGDKYKYTFKVKEEKGNTFVTKRTNYQFSKITHNGTEATLTPLEGTTKQVSLLANKLFDKLQLKTTVVTKQDKLGNEIDTTLELNFPIVEKPKPVVSTVPDHEVDADKVPSTFPTNVKGELKYQKDNSQLSTYANLFEKDVTVEKIGDKYKYTFKVKEAKGNTFVTKRTNYQFSKITHNGTEATLTPLEGTTKQVSLLTDKLLDKLQLKTTLVTKQDKQGNEIDTTLELDFSAVEKNVEKPYNTVPATLLDATIEKPSMGNGALLGDKTRVEKIGDTYHYYVTFKDLQFAGLTGSVDNLKVNGQVADAKDLGGELNEKQYHFTSSDKLTVTPVTIDVLVGGKPFHKNTPARISFNWDKATSLTEEAVNKLHADETAKAEAVKLAKEKAEADRLAKEKAEKEKAEAERLAKEKAEKEKAEAERLAKEKAEKEKNQPAYFSNPKVTFNEDKSLATFADNDGDTPVKVTIPTAGLENDVYELEVVKVTVPGLDSNNEVYDIHFVTKDGKVRQIKQPASIKVPVERKVISAYHIDKDGANKQNIENFSNVKENNVNYVVIEAKHFSLYGFEYENTSAQPVKPQPSTNEKEVKPQPSTNEKEVKSQPNINESEVNKPTQTSIQNNKTPKTVLNNKNITNNSIVVKNNKKELPKTGINSSSVIGLGFIALLSALLLNRKRNN